MSAIREEERGLGELFGELTEEARRLLHQEVALAKTEMTEKAAAAAKNGAAIAAGGLVAWTGVQILLAAAVIGLGMAIGYGWSALIIGVLVVIAGAVMLMVGINKLKRMSLVPEKTATQIRETKQWMKRQI